MLRRMLSTSAGPVEKEIYRKLTTTFAPSVLEIRNDSHKHAHHAGLRGASNVTESHFFVTMVSEKFEGMNQPSRHRAVYKELDEEFKQKGLHALQLKTKTPKEI